MLGWGDIAQESSAAHGGDGPADGSGDVVIAGGDVGDQGAQHIEGGSHADGLLHLHVGGDLVHGHMAGPLHHHLHVLLPGPFGQLAQADQFLDLTYIGGVSQAAGAAGVAQGDGHIVLPADIQDLVVELIEGILLPGHAHPCEHKGTAP